MVTTLKLFDLAGADDALRFSPFCWRTRLALAHKGLPVDTIAWRFTEKEAIAPSGQGKVPVLVDGDRWLSDSWKIAEYLEAAHPDRPSLFGSAQGKALTRFFNQWANEILQPALVRVVLPDIFAVLHEKDRAYFRASREAALGASIEAFAGRREEALEYLARDPQAATQYPGRAALSHRRRAGLCRPYRFRRLSMGAGGEPNRAGLGRRSDRRLDRTHARRLWRSCPRRPAGAIMTLT